MELSVSLRDIDVPASDAERLCDGDIVATGLPADGEVIVRLAGIPKFLARMGQVDGRRAITILRRL
jgi:flagellar motor switch protein FliM